MKERVAAAEHTERRTYAESSLWGASVKTIPELHCRTHSKQCRIPASKDGICRKPSEKSRWNRAFLCTLDGTAIGCICHGCFFNNQYKTGG